MEPTLTIAPSVYYFGTPVVLLATLMPDGVATNITPISSAWALGDTYVLGLGVGGQALHNLQRTGELVINPPDVESVAAIERIAPTTGAADIPAHKRARYRHERDKWTLGRFSAVPSEVVRPERIAQCPVQIEAEVLRLTPLGDGGDAMIVHARARRVHAHASVVVPGTSHIDLDNWRPVYYTFRHYFAQGEHVGRNFRAEQ